MIGKNQICLKCPAGKVAISETGGLDHTQKQIKYDEMSKKFFHEK